MGSNFIQWNPGAVNQENDATYEADTMRSGGATVGVPMPSPLANKLFYQLSTLAAALAGAMADKGYTVSDANLAALQAVMDNLLTQNDLLPYAPKASPALTGSPTAPTQAYNDSSTKLATTAMVNASPKTFAVPGYIKFGNGLILQWMIGPTDPADANTAALHTLTFPVVFPNACLVALVSMDMATNTSSQDSWYQTLGWNAATVTYQRQYSGTGTSGSTTRGVLIALGY